MSDFHNFSDDAISGAISVAHEHYHGDGAQALGSTVDHSAGHLSLLAECISVDISNGKVCLTLPLGIGKVCIPVPISYDGKVAQACLSICTTFGFPTGVKVTVSVAGVTIVTKSFLKC